MNNKQKIKIMKTMKIVFLCSTLGLFFLASCMQNVGNSMTFSTDNAVVGYYTDAPGMTFLNTSYGIQYGVIAAPELNGNNYKKGDCLSVSFTIDFDNQPNSKYYTASNVNYKKIGKTDIIMLDAGSQNINDSIAKLSVDSIKNLGFAGSTWCSIDNNLFMGFDQFNVDKSYDYQLVYSDSLINNIPVLYVCAKEANPSSATIVGDYRYQAFDITPFLAKYADENNNFSFYLKYKKGVDANNKNIYAFLSANAYNLVNLKFIEN